MLWQLHLWELGLWAGTSAGVHHGAGCKQGISPWASSLNFSCDFWHQGVNDNPWCAKLLASGQLHFLKESSGRIGSLCSGDWCWEVKTALAFLRRTPALPANPSHWSQMFCCSPDTSRPTDLDLGSAPCFRTWCYILNYLMKKFREVQVHQNCMDNELYIGNTSWSLTKTGVFYRLFGIWAVGCRDVVSCDKLALASGFEAIQLMRFCKPRITLILPLLIVWSCSNSNIFHVETNIFFFFFLSPSYRKESFQIK